MLLKLGQGSFTTQRGVNALLLNPTFLPFSEEFAYADLASSQH